MNSKKIIFNVTFNVLFLIITFIITEAYGTQEFSGDKLPPEMKVTVAQFVTDKMCKSKYDRLVWFSQTPKISSNEFRDTHQNFKREFNALFDLRLISSEWRDAVDQAFITRNLSRLSISLTAANSHDAVVGRIAHLVKCLTFDDWNQQNCFQINKLISEYAFDNIVRLKISTDVDFNLAEILKKCPKITELYLEGLWDGTQTVGNENLSLYLANLLEDHPKNLRILSLAKNNLKDDILFYLYHFAHLDYFKQLEQLDLNSNKITLEGLRYLTYHLALPADKLPCLKVLDL